MKSVKITDIVTGIAIVVLGLPGACDGKMYYKSFPVMFPRQFGWTLIVFGVSIPVAAYILRSRQEKRK